MNHDHRIGSVAVEALMGGFTPLIQGQGFKVLNGACCRRIISTSENAIVNSDAHFRLAERLENAIRGEKFRPEYLFF
ncbi:hypothetical protein [Achromobacter pulmonis]|uniref:hypothetical protein n=1 Tax=Achromobacter pulmonis TaxID=1389932 RepID=UPI003C76C0C6